MIEETIKLFSSELCIKPEQSRVHFTLRLWQDGLLHHHTVVWVGQSSLCCICQGSLVLSGEEGCDCRYGKQSRESCCVLRPGMFKMVLVLALLRTLFCFFSYVSVSIHRLLSSLFVFSPSFFSIWCNRLLHHGYNPGFDKQRITPSMGRAGS